jgi:hypothetical protein
MSRIKFLFATQGLGEKAIFQGSLKNSDPDLLGRRFFSVSTTLILQPPFTLVFVISSSYRDEGIDCG